MPATLYPAKGYTQEQTLKVLSYLKKNAEYSDLFCNYALSSAYTLFFRLIKIENRTDMAEHYTLTKSQEILDLIDKNNIDSLPQARSMRC